MLDWYISTSVRLLQLNTPFLRIKKPSSFPHLKIEIPSSSHSSFANGSSARRLRRQSGKRKLHTEMTLRKTKSLFFCDSGGWARRRRELVFILALPPPPPPPPLSSILFSFSPVHPSRLVYVSFHLWFPAATEDRARTRYDGAKCVRCPLPPMVWLVKGGKRRANLCEGKREGGRDAHLYGTYRKS